MDEREEKEKKKNNRIGMAWSEILRRATSARRVGAPRFTPGPTPGPSPGLFRSTPRAWEGQEVAKRKKPGREEKKKKKEKEKQ